MIEEVFKHADVIGQRVIEGRFDLIGLDGGSYCQRHGMMSSTWVRGHHVNVARSAVSL